MKKTAASNPYSIGKGGKSPANNPPKAPMRSESHTYDSNRPKRPVVSRYK